MWFWSVYYSNSTKTYHYCRPFTNEVGRGYTTVLNITVRLKNIGRLVISRHENIPGSA